MIVSVTNATILLHCDVSEDRWRGVYSGVCLWSVYHAHQLVRLLSFWNVCFQVGNAVIGMNACRQEYQYLSSVELLMTVTNTGWCQYCPSASRSQTASVQGTTCNTCDLPQIVLAQYWVGLPLWASHRQHLSSVESVMTDQSQIVCTSPPWARFLVALTFSYSAFSFPLAWTKACSNLTSSLSSHVLSVLWTDKFLKTQYPANPAPQSPNQYQTPLLFKYLPGWNLQIRPLCHYRQTMTAILIVILWHPCQQHPQKLQIFEKFIQQPTQRRNTGFS